MKTIRTYKGKKYMIVTTKDGIWSTTVYPCYITKTKALIDWQTELFYTEYSNKSAAERGHLLIADNLGKYL